MSSEVEWPWQYNFPPFFTLQPHKETRVKQITAWKALILDYCGVNKICSIDLRETNEMSLFTNAAINRTLESSALLVILEELQNSGNAIPMDKQRQRWEIYWHTLEEFSQIIYNYVMNSNSLDMVLTIFELTESDDVANEEFYKLNSDVFIKVLRVLEKDNKCELILLEDSQGVKFF
ncbi:PREDICTED: vacuolar protein-sorting-associated protein 25 [Nicrophorus vespilloides]|uniref:Vacuolar protein-sorting-associated protein 25 n=1 Tax=Nicrophorus vespilloides TaxID=110193 RepID=A0ABM1MI18_NICVS|nr:PREDICTED: vacuolar protein-sorting-associated protein 25 [Nicrophorus vespilloides]